MLRISSRQPTQYLGGGQLGRYQGWRKLQISSVSGREFLGRRRRGCRWVGQRCYWGVQHTVVRPEKKTSRGISVDFPKYLGLSLPVCLSGSEQPLDTSQEKSDSDIPFQDGECWDKYGGAGDADQGARAGEHDFEVSAGQVPDHLQLARRDCRQTGLVSFSFGTWCQNCLITDSMLWYHVSLPIYQDVSDLICSKMYNMFWYLLKKSNVYQNPIFAGCHVGNPNKEQEGCSRHGHLCWTTIPQIPSGALFEFTFFSVALHSSL